MSDESPDWRAEVSALREECAALRREVRKLRDLFGLFEDEPDYPAPKLMNFDQVECIGFRHDSRMPQLPIVIRAHPDSAEISFFDEKIVCRGSFGVYPEGARLELRNSKGELVLGLGEGKDGSGQIFVADAAGKVRSSMRVSGTGGVVNVVDEKGRPLAAMCNGGSGGEIFVTNGDLKIAASLKSTERGGAVTVSEPGGQVMGFLMGTSDGGSMQVYGSLGAPAFAVGGGDPGGVAVFYDEEGNKVKALP